MAELQKSDDIFWTYLTVLLTDDDDDFVKLPIVIPTVLVQ